MSQTEALVGELKQVLKARKLNYAQVADALKLSEATVKRMFSRNDFTLERFEQVCQLADVSVSELAREVDRERNYLSSLTVAQEKELVANPRLFLVAVCALNHLSLEQIIATYDLTRSEAVKLLLQLDRIRFLELLPNNGIKLKVARTFAWLPDGPIRRFFLDRAEREYFRCGFDRDGEFIAVVNGMLSAASSAQLVTRLKRLARDFSELHDDDRRLALGQRRPASLLLAIRPWELDAFHQLRRPRR
jgi:transcriptional regulator with XRE-family HTH domain